MNVETYDVVTINVMGGRLTYDALVTSILDNHYVVLVQEGDRLVTKAVEKRLTVLAKDK